MRGRAAQPGQTSAALRAHAARGRASVVQEHWLRVAHVALGFAFEAVGENRVGQLSPPRHNPLTGTSERQAFFFVCLASLRFKLEIPGLAARAQLVHNLFHVLRAVARADEQRVVCVHDDEIG